MKRILCVLALLAAVAATAESIRMKAKGRSMIEYRDIEVLSGDEFGVRVKFASKAKLTFLGDEINVMNGGGITKLYFEDMRPEAVRKYAPKYGYDPTKAKVPLMINGRDKTPQSVAQEQQGAGATLASAKGAAMADYGKRGGVVKAAELRIVQALEHGARCKIVSVADDQYLAIHPELKESHIFVLGLGSDNDYAAGDAWKGNLYYAGVTSRETTSGAASSLRQFATDRKLALSTAQNDGDEDKGDGF